MIKENDEIFDRLGDLVYRDLDDLLCQYKHLLKVDIEKLGEGPLANK